MRAGVEASVETDFAVVAGGVAGVVAGAGAAAEDADRVPGRAGAGACADNTTAQVSPMKPATMSLFI